MLLLPANARPLPMGLRQSRFRCPRHECPLVQIAALAMPRCRQSPFHPTCRMHLKREGENRCDSRGLRASRLRYYCTAISLSVPKDMQQGAEA
jgi:hypothetical protein